MAKDRSRDAARSRQGLDALYERAMTYLVAVGAIAKHLRDLDSEVIEHGKHFRGLAGLISKALANGFLLTMAVHTSRKLVTTARRTHALGSVPKIEGIGTGPSYLELVGIDLHDNFFSALGIHTFAMKNSIISVGREGEQADSFDRSVAELGERLVCLPAATRAALVRRLAFPATDFVRATVLLRQEAESARGDRPRAPTGATRTERMDSGTSARKGAASPAVTPGELEVLRALARRPKVRLHPEKLTVRAPGPASDRGLREALRQLHKRGLVDYPPNGKKGAAITEAGLALLSAIDAAR